MEAALRKRRQHRRKLAGAFIIFLLLKRLRDNDRRFWVRPFLSSRESLDSETTMPLLQLAREDDEDIGDTYIQRSFFKCLLRLSYDDFCHLHDKVKHLIAKKDTNYREAIPSETRLALTLRFLATGDNYDTLEKIFKISKSSITNIIPQTCRAIISELQSYIKVPKNQQEWQEVEKGFNKLWDFPNCIGAIDGRHCPIICPKFSGTDFFNYKHFYSVVLMAVVDAQYNFVFVDVGAQGRISDGGVFKNTSFSNQLENETLNIPQPKPLPGQQGTCPFVFVADDAFPLKENIMKPLPGITEEGSPQRMYNYRVSRARRVVENAFGIVSARFRVLRKPMCINPSTAALIVTTCCYLHNYIRKNNSEDYTPAGFIDGDGNDGGWRDIQVHGPMNGLLPWRNYPKKSAERAKAVREEFIKYFSSPAGGVQWPIPYH